MKKILGFFANILLAIVYPNRILSIFRVKNLDQNSNKILGNDGVVRILALIFALIFVFVSRYTPAPPVDYQRPVNVVLERILDEDSYVITGGTIPQHVDVILTGDRTAIDLFVNAGTDPIRAYIDLDAFGEGVHGNILIEVTDIPDYITARVNPSVVEEVVIARLEEMQMPVEVIPRLPDDDVRSRYRAGDITIYPTYVTVRGPQSILNEIDTVLANFAISDEELTLEGVTKEISVVANNRDFETVRGVTFDPPTVEVRLEVYEDVREIELELNENLLNVPRDQYEILSVTPDITEIEIWGDFDNLLDWDGFDREEETFQLTRINFRELDEDGVYTIRLQLPPYIYTEIDGEIVQIIEITVTVEYEALPTEIPTEAPATRSMEDLSWLLDKTRKHKLT